MRERWNEKESLCPEHISLSAVKTADEEIFQPLLKEDNYNAWVESGKFSGRNRTLYNSFNETIGYLEDCAPHRFDPDFFKLGTLLFHRALRYDFDKKNEEIPVLDNDTVLKKFNHLYLPLGTNKWTKYPGYFFEHSRQISQEFFYQEPNFKRYLEKYIPLLSEDNSRLSRKDFATPLPESRNYRSLVDGISVMHAIFKR